MIGMFFQRVAFKGLPYFCTDASLGLGWRRRRRVDTSLYMYLSNEGDMVFVTRRGGVCAWLFLYQLSGRDVGIQGFSGKRLYTSRSRVLPLSVTRKEDGIPVTDRGESRQRAETDTEPFPHVFWHLWTIIHCCRACEWLLVTVHRPNSEAQSMNDICECHHHHHLSSSDPPPSPLHSIPAPPEAHA